MKAIILARVSSKAQEDEGFSLDAQAKLLTEYCMLKGLEVAKLFRLAETASKNEERETFKEMMFYISKHKIGHLVVEKTDRLTRNFKDAVRINQWIEGNENRHVHFVKEAYLLHKNSRSHEKFLWSIRVAMAQNYTDNLREESKKGIMEKLEQGWLPASIPPPGYMTVSKDGRKIHVPDPRKAPLVKKLFDMYLEPTHSIRSVMLSMNELGLRTHKGRPYTKDGIQRILTNPFYYGVNRWQGKDYPGKQKPIITKTQWDAVQSKLAGKRPPKYIKHNPTFRNMFTCVGCGGVITWEQQRGNWYGRCHKKEACPRRQYAREIDVEEKVIDALKRLMCPSEEVIDWVKDQLTMRFQVDMAAHEATRNQIQQDLERVIRQQGILYEDRLAERIDLDRYESTYAQLEEKRVRIKDKLERVSEIYESRFGKAMNILELSQKAAELYVSKSVDTKRNIIGLLFSNMQLDGSLPLLEFTPLAESIAKRSERSREVISEIRTLKNPRFNRGRGNLNVMLRPVWQGIQSEVRTFLREHDTIESAENMTVLTG